MIRDERFVSIDRQMDAGRSRRSLTNTITLFSVRSRSLELNIALYPSFIFFCFFFSFSSSLLKSTKIRICRKRVYFENNANQRKTGYEDEKLKIS